MRSFSRGVVGRVGRGSLAEEGRRPRSIDSVSVRVPGGGLWSTRIRQDVFGCSAAIMRSVCPAALSSFGTGSQARAEEPRRERWTNMWAGGWMGRGFDRRLMGDRAGLRNVKRSSKQASSER